LAAWGGGEKRRPRRRTCPWRASAERRWSRGEAAEAAAERRGGKEK